jgi:hypothetical protein
VIPEGKRELAKHQHGRQDNITVDIQKWGEEAWTGFICLE